MFAGLAAQTKFWGRPIKFDQASYNKRLEGLANTQLAYTVGNLPPADSVGLFKVAFKTSESSAAGDNKGGASGIIDEAGKAVGKEASLLVPTTQGSQKP